MENEIFLDLCLQELSSYIVSKISNRYSWYFSYVKLCIYAINGPTLCTVPCGQQKPLLFSLTINNFLNTEIKKCVKTLDTLCYNDFCCLLQNHQYFRSIIVYQWLTQYSREQLFCIINLIEYEIIGCYGKDRSTYSVFQLLHIRQQCY